MSIADNIEELLEYQVDPTFKENNLNELLNSVSIIYENLEDITVEDAIIIWKLVELSNEVTSKMLKEIKV